MKILGLMGSPRRAGNTEILLDTALAVAQEEGSSTIKVLLRDKKIAPCNGCLKCARTGNCVLKDDMEEIYIKMLESDAIIWATPVYFWSMSSLTKLVMDRTYSLMFPKLQLENKVGGVIIVAATKGCMNTANIFHMYFISNHMFFAEYAWGYAREKGEIKRDQYAKNLVTEMTRQVVSLTGSKLKFPEQFDAPLYRYAKDKYI